MVIVENFLKAKKLVLDILFPKFCISCRSEGNFLCTSCRDKFEYKEQSVCPSCDSFSECGATCSQCLDKTMIDGLLVLGNYQNKVLQNSIKFWKYNFAQEFSGIFSYWLAGMFENQSNPFVDESWVLTSIPLHPRRYRERGFNQAEGIARAAARSINHDYQDLLKRSKYTKPQAKGTRADRLSLAKDTFLTLEKEVFPKNIIICDDVYTTGRTMNVAAKALKDNGAEQVWGLVLAKGG